MRHRPAGSPGRRDAGGVWRAIVVAYALGLLVCSLLPVASPASLGAPDLLVHLAGYGLFAWLLVQAIRAGGARERGHLVLVWIYATSYGLLIELLQGVVPWRAAELTDAAANGVGAALGVWLGQRLPSPGS